jgi:uncharacterized membrane protein (UPF0127 family)
MKFAIDVAYLTREYRVRKIVQELKPWRISLCLRATGVLEVPAGTLSQTRTAVGDQLALEPHPCITGAPHLG